MTISEILGLQKKKLDSNITPINRMGRPVKSVRSRYAEQMPANDTRLGFLKGGDLVSGLTGAIQGYLGFSGAKKDAQNEAAYNDYLAQQAEQERADKLAQQQWEQEYKDRALAQQAQLQREARDAENERQKNQFLFNMQQGKTARAQTLADRDAQYAHEKELYDLKRADAIADRDAQIQAAIDAEKRKQEYEQFVSAQKAKEAQDAAMLKSLDEIAQKRLTAEDYAKWRQNPSAYDITGDGWFKRKLGVRASIEPKAQQFAEVSDEELLKGL